MNFAKQATLKNRWIRNFVLSILSAILFSIAWWGGTSLSLFLAFVPLMIITDSCSKRHYLIWNTLTIVAWTLFTTMWVAKATILGPIAASAVSVILFSIPFILYKIVRSKATKALAYTVFVSAWVACEYLYLYNEEISHPWLILGNGFANNTLFIQWYEYTGTLGGSLWVLIVNIIIYEAMSKRSRKLAVTAGTFILIPIIFSAILYYNYEEKVNPVKVTVIQPNIDPYKDKFNGMSPKDQDKLIQTLSLEAPKDVKYIVAPETSINDNIDIDRPLQSSSVASYQHLMQANFPDAEFIIGASMYKIYPKSAEPPTLTARDATSYYYDVINGSMQIKSNSIESYIKSRLVIGVEMVPFPKMLKNFSVDLGGISGALTTQPDRELFGVIAAPICYESIYGDFITGFVRNGAQAIFIITNDGWWGNTLGYIQHFSYARLRAIENRRSIARSANTGISGFIDQRGDVTQELGWWKRGTLTSDINLNSEMTVYSKYGDYIGRLSAYILAISLLYCVAYVYKKKSNLN